jgi:HK97 family phage prohead protease
MKGDQVYRAGVIAAKQRAAQQKASAVEDAAGELLDLIDDKDAKSARGILERRAAGDAPAAKEGKISGYAAMFNSPTDIAGMFREQIAPGAFADSLSRGDDVRALFNHDPNFVLGRTSNGTLTLSEDAKGLRFDVTPPETVWAKDLMASIERGDINQCSFAFQVDQQSWDDPDDEENDMPLRTLKRVSLSDVSTVTYPAYDDTSCSVRALEAHLAERAASPATLARARMRLAQLDRKIRA